MSGEVRADACPACVDQQRVVVLMPRDSDGVAACAHRQDPPEKKKRGRAGIGTNGEKGVRVQVNLSRETLAGLDEWRGETGRGPALRQLAEMFFADDNGFTARVKRYRELLEGLD